MKVKVENFLIDRLTKKISVAVIESDGYIYRNFKDYLNLIFEKVNYCFDSSDVESLFKLQKPDLVFIDLQTKNLHPFKLIEEIRGKHPYQIFIAVSNTKDPDLLIKVIKSKCNDLILKKFDLNVLKDAVIESLEYVIRNHPEKLLDQELEKVKDISVDEALDILIDNYNFDIELVNHYKGIPIIKDAALVDKSGDNVLVKIKDIQGNALEHSHHAIISSRFLSNDIYATLKSLDMEKNIACFEKLSFINSYVHHRKNVRVVPDDSFKMFYEIKGIKHKCNVIDISQNYCLISLDTVPNEFNISGSLDFYLSFKLPSQSLARRISSLSHALKASFTINDIFSINGKTKILLAFSLNDEDDRLLHDYIYARSLTLIKEYKSKEFK